MAENIFNSFNISEQGMSLQRMRLSAVSRNIANVNTTKDADGKPYQRETVIVKGLKDTKFENELNREIQVEGTESSHGSNISNTTYPPTYPLFQSYIAKDERPPRLIYEPGHPHAREDGYLEVPDINIVTEMVEMMTAQRAFEANVQVTEAAKNFAKYSLEI